MLGFGPISSRAISALPSFLATTLSLAFTGTVTWEAAPFSPYRALLTEGSRVVYTMELNVRTVR